MTKKQKNFLIRTILFLIIAVICGASFFWQDYLETEINNLINPPLSTDIEGCELKTHFINIGQGDSTCIELPDNKIMLIDAGPGRSEDTLINYLNNAIFAKRDDRIIDYFIVTHQDEDHVGGADKVFDNFIIKNFYRPKVYTDQEYTKMKQENDGLTLSNDSLCNTRCYRDMIYKMENENCQHIVLNSVYKSMPYLQENCGYTIEFLAPIDEVYSDPNDYSPVMQITYQERKIMLTGDAEKKSEMQVVNTYSDVKLKSDILKLGHHGSDTSSCQEFLDAVSPTYAVISCGKDNKYGHPKPDVMERVTNKIGANNIYRTDVDNNIIFGIDKDKISMGKGTINIALNGEAHSYVRIEWWYIIVTILGVSFIIIYLPKRKQKQIKKYIENN